MMADVTSSIPATPKLGMRVSDAALSPVTLTEPPLFGSSRCRIPDCLCPCHFETKSPSDFEDTSPLELAVARANSWIDLPQSALRAMYEAMDGRRRTKIVHQQLAMILGGTTQVPQFRTPFKKGISAGTRSGVRLYDVVANGRFIEVKIGGDRVTLKEIEKDRYLVSLGVPVEYHFVCDPINARYHNPLDVKVLEEERIPYKIWGWGFWNP